MAINFKKARDFVYANGVLWERALFSWLFEDGSLTHLHDCLRAYKNPDAGYGHGFEHDIKTPDSHPLAVEALLTTLVGFNIPVGDLLDGTSLWLESVQNEDGSLRNPPSVLEYPHAPWWNEGGQNLPDSIAGNLIRLNAITPAYAEKTRAWVQANITLESIKANDWLFMAYHAYDYFFAVGDFPELADYQQATVENVVKCASIAPDNQLADVFRYVSDRQSAVAQALPKGLLDRALDTVFNGQNEDGSWHDQHGLSQWYAITTIGNLHLLSKWGR